MSQRFRLSQLAASSIAVAVLLISVGAHALAVGGGIVYPPSITTDKDKECYRYYDSAKGGCTIDYNSNVAACDASGSNWFSRQACYLGAYYTYDSCMSEVGRVYGNCLIDAHAATSSTVTAE